MKLSLSDAIIFRSFVCISLVSLISACDRGSLPKDQAVQTQTASELTPSVEEPVTSSDQSNALVDELSRGAENDLYADPEIPYAPPSKNEPLPPKKSCDDMPCDWEVGITSVSHMGTGCPEGSVNVVLSEDKKALTLVFSEFVAEAGPDLDASLASASCDLRIDIQQSSHWSYSLEAVDMRGYAGLDEGVEATLSSVATRSDRVGSTSTFQALFQGSYFGDYALSVPLVESESSWSQCASHQVRLKTRASVSAENAPDNFGLLTVDSTDGELEQRFKLRWRRCDI